jgi:hypothetical protein
MFSARKITALVFGLILVGTLSSCTLPWAQDQGFCADCEEVSVATLSGLRGEQFLPPDLENVSALNTLDVSQAATFRKVEKRFYFEKDAAYELLKSFVSRLAPYKIDYEQDIKPIFGRNFRIVGGEVGDDFVTTLTVSNVDALDALFAKLQLAEEFVIDEYSGYKVLNGVSDSVYMALYKDILIVASDRDKVLEAIDRKDLLAATVENSSGFSDFKKNVGLGDTAYFYRPDLGLSFSLALDGAYMKVFSPKAGYFKNATTFNLTDEIFTKDMVAYFEGMDLAQVLRARILDEDRGDFESFKSSFKSATDLDFENDVLKFLNRGYALGLYDNGSILPGILLLADASSKPDAAKKVVESLNNQVASIVDGLAASYVSEEDSSNVASRKKLAIDEGVGYMVEIDFGLILTSVRSEKFVFSFGLTGDNLFFISTYKDFATTFSSLPLKNDNDFASALKKLSGEQSFGRMYILFKPLKVFMDRLFDYRTDVEKLVAKDFMDFYDKNQSYLNPLKSGIFSVEKLEDSGVLIESFLQFD